VTDGTNIKAYEDFKIELRKKYPVPRALFEQQFASVQRAVIRRRSQGTLSCLFKGKWLESIVSAELEHAFRGKSVNLRAVGPRLSSAAVTMFNFSSDWAQAHIEKLSELFARIPEQT
jgi:hypothetical protein